MCNVSSKEPGRNFREMVGLDTPLPFRGKGNEVHLPTAIDCLLH